VRRCPWPLSPQVIAPCSTRYELLQLLKLRRSFGTPGLLCRLATVPGERQAAARRAGHHSPGSVPHLPHSQPHHQQRKKQVGPARRECLHATGSGAGDITTTPASSPPPLVAAPAATLTERYRGVHLEAGRRVPSGRPGEPPTVRICLSPGRWRSPVPDLPGRPGRPRALAGDRRPVHS
jgi:hypothetical protein